MRKSFKHIAIWFTLSLFLFTTGGFSLYIHTCTSSGHVAVSLLGENHSCCKVKVKPKSCCDKIAQPVKKSKTACCKDKVFKKQLKVENTSSQKTLVQFTVPSFEFNFNYSNSYATIIPVALANNSPPPLSGRQLLIQKQVFII